MLGYHFPSVAGIGFSLELLKRLKDSFPLQFAGIKDSSHDQDFARSLGETFGDDLAVFSGTDSDLTSALEHHACGCITAPANVISPGLREIFDAHTAGRDPSAAQAKVSRQRHVLEQYQPFPPLLKSLLVQLHGQPRWPVRPPLVEIPASQAQQAVRELNS